MNESESRKKRRRSPEERVAELRATIERIEQRSAVQRPHVKQARLAAAGLARAATAAGEAEDRELADVLERATSQVRAVLVERGVRVKGASS